jgi:probable addiction module antidote protein
MSKASTSYREGLIKDLANAEEAAAYLNAALEDGSQEVFLMALRDIAEAKGMARLSRKAHLNRESMYRMLSGKGNPQLSSLAAILECAGLRLAVEVREQKMA